MSEQTEKRGRGRPKKERETIKFERLAEGIYALNYKTNQSKIKYTKEQLLGYLETNNEQKLREASHYFFRISGEYRRLVQYYSNILTFDYLVIPKVKDSEQFNQRSFQPSFQGVLDYTDNSYIQETSRFINGTIVLDGVFYGYERQIGNEIVLQQLPPDYCRSKYKINGNHAIEFNLRFFDLYKDVEQKISIFKLLPDEFLDLYLQYKDGKSLEWVQLNPEFARCHKLFDNPSPLLAPVFTELINLKEYKELDKTQSKMNLYKLVIQKLPVDKNTGVPLLKLEEGQALHANAKKMISQEGIDVLTTPLEVDSVNLQEKGQSLRDNIERAMNGVYTATGTSMLLFNSGTTGGSIGLNNSLKVDEALLFTLLDQIKMWYDTKFTYINKNKNYKYELLLPKITIFNRKEMFDLFKEAATLGFSKLMPLTAMGIKQTTFMNMMSFENDYLKLHEKMIPLSTSYTQSGEAGRPEKDQNDLSDKGLKTKDTEANDNRSK